MYLSSKYFILYICTGFYYTFLNRTRDWRDVVVSGRIKTGRWQLYIVKCRDGTLYTGITNDIERRLEMHNAGTASRYTRSRLPVELVYQEPCRGKSSALKKEYAFKQLSRPEKEEYIATSTLKRKAVKVARKARTRTQDPSTLSFPGVIREFL